jgi:hypothetical protein
MNFHIPKGAWDIDIAIYRIESSGASRRKMVDQSIGHITRKYCFKLHKCGLKFEIEEDCDKSQKRL